MTQDPLYPSRSYPYRLQTGVAAGLQGPGLDDLQPVGAPSLKARIVGLDSDLGRDMTAAELDGLADPMASLILKRGTFPTTMRELLDALNVFNNDPIGLPAQRTFVISEWGQIPLIPATEKPARQLRYVVARGKAETGGSDLLISTAPPSDNPRIFLQVAAWDRVNTVFHYYERSGTTWFWEGNSWHALSDPSRGKGPFDSHINGAPVMKERKAPWLHWSSQAQEISRENFPADHPINRPSENALFAGHQSAHLLQSEIVEPAVRRWTDARLTSVLASGSIANPSALMRQVLTATSVNIASSQQRAQSNEQEILIPATMFADTDTFTDVLLPDTPIGVIAVPRPIYQQAISSLQVVLRDTQQAFQQAGDSFFAWPVPERAFEDNLVVDGLVQNGVLSAQFATALLMVDFSNPIDSSRRAALMRHVPAGQAAAAGVDGLQGRMLQSISAEAARDATSDEADIVRFMTLKEGDWQTDAGNRISALMDAIRVHVTTLDGVMDYLRLADWRRRAFRRNRHLAEFNLSLPFSSIADDAPAVDLTPDGRVVQRDAAIA